MANGSPAIKISDKKKLVPKLRSKINMIEADNNTGNDNNPTMAVKKKPQIVRGNLNMVIPLVLMFSTVAI